VSNSNWEHLRGYEDRILVGAEVINGTGEVGLKFFEEAGPDKGDMVFFTLTIDAALDFARLLSAQAHEAMRAKWNESNLNVG
jgi:hypothetical protein